MFPVGSIEPAYNINRGSSLTLIKPEKAKVFMMLRTEYDQKAHDKALYDDGKAEGERDRATKIALLMLQNKEDPVRIRKYTGLSAEQIAKLMKGSGHSE